LSEYFFVRRDPHIDQFLGRHIDAALQGDGRIEGGLGGVRRSLDFGHFENIGQFVLRHDAAQRQGGIVRNRGWHCLALVKVMAFRTKAAPSFDYLAKGGMQRANTTER
jgi:hypothetical protein